MANIVVARDNIRVWLLAVMIHIVIHCSQMVVYWLTTYEGPDGASVACEL